LRDGLLRLGRYFASASPKADAGSTEESLMPDTRGHNEVYCPDRGLQRVASQSSHSTGCRHLDLTKRPSQVVAAWQQTRDQSGGSRPQVPPGQPGPLSMGAEVGPRDSRSQPEPTRPEPEPPPQPTKPPEPELPKPEAIAEETLGKVDRLDRGIAVVLLVAVAAVPVAW
jgi:hypothetical protein